MTRQTRSLTAAASLLAACAIIAVGAGAVGAKGKGRADSGTTYAAITHIVGKTQIAAGNTTDKVLGKGAVTFALTLGTGSKPGTIVAKGTVVVYTSTGSLSGSDSVDITPTSTGELVFTNGKLNLSKGSGGQKGHSFVGTFTGTGKTASGPFVFHEKGTYR
ncbi:MAG: hypothetical protein ACR2MK_10865 [Solirubrobacteraceae bacterium]